MHTDGIVSKNTMTSKSKSQKETIVPYQSQFVESLLKIGYCFSLPQVFDDFLTMVIAACTQNPQTKVSYYEDEYLTTIAKYKESDLRHEFPKVFSYLVLAMEERVQSSSGNDVLGEFYELHISHGKNGEFFTPAPVCQFMASALALPTKTEETENHKPLRILDPACGSGRMLLAAHKMHHYNHEYYGIDINRTCVKMAALNLFLNGMWHSEVMCANALLPDDFVIAYYISLLPFGIFKIEEKEKSILWNLHRSSFERKQNKSAKSTELFKQFPSTDSTQLDLFT